MDLCAASAFLDAFAQSRSRRPGPAVLAIDWDTWRDVGMAADVRGLPEELLRAREQALATGIAPAEGRAVFARILERAETAAGRGFDPGPGSGRRAPAAP